MASPTQEQQLREEFNRWAEQGRGEEMEEHHLPVVRPMLAMLDVAPADKILDVGCGTGWLCRRLAARVPEGVVLGLDVSEEMVERARKASTGFRNLTFLTGSADRIPGADNLFTKVVSVESAYYWPDPAQGIREIFRVLAAGGSAWILINYYLDNPHCHQWGAHYLIPSHLLSAEDWAGKFRAAGFGEVRHRRIPDPTPTPEVYTGRWFKDAEQMRRFKEEGALLVFGKKPALP